jgi:hypothetical protein
VRTLGNRHRELLEQLVGAMLHVDLVELAGDARRSGSDQLVSQEQVRDHVEVVGEGEILVDGRDPEAGGVARGGDRDRLAVEEELARVGVVDAGDRLHERRFAGAVVADERHHLARAHGEVDAVERLDRPEALRHVLEREDRPVRGRPVGGHRPPGSLGEEGEPVARPALSVATRFPPRRMRS